MSRALPPPWLRATVLDLLSTTPPKNVNKRKLRARAVQIIRSNESFDLLIVNDKENYISVMLTEECIENLKEENVELSSLKHCIVKLEKYHISTAIQAAGDRDVSKFSHVGVSLPLTIQCSKLTFLGASDCDVIGDPVDLNKDARVRAVLSQIQFWTLAERLASGQFPNETFLPDSMGEFTFAPPFSDENPLLLQHCCMPDEVRKKLDEIVILDYNGAEHGPTSTENGSSSSSSGSSGSGSNAALAGGNQGASAPSVAQLLPETLVEEGTEAEKVDTGGQGPLAYTQVDTEAMLAETQTQTHSQTQIDEQFSRMKTRSSQHSSDERAAAGVAPNATGSSSDRNISRVAAAGVAPVLTRAQIREMTKSGRKSMMALAKLASPLDVKLRSKANGAADASTEAVVAPSQSGESKQNLSGVLKHTLIQLQSQEGFRNSPPLGDTQTTTTSTTAVAGLPIDVTNLDLTAPSSSSSSSSTSAQEKKKPGRLDTDLEWINQPMTEDSLESLEKWLGSQSSPPAFITQTRSDVHTQTQNQTQTRTQTQKEVDKGGNSVGAITVVETGTMGNVHGDNNGVAASTAAAAATTATATAAIASAPTSNAGGSTTENGANLEISDRLFNMLRAGGVDVIEPVSRAIFLALNKAPKAYLGRKVKKMFPGYGEYVGRICKFKSPWFLIKYDDGDTEELAFHELARYLLDSKGRKATEESELVAAAAIAAAADLGIQVDAPIKVEKFETEKKQGEKKKKQNAGPESTSKDDKQKYIYGDDGATGDEYRRGDDSKKRGDRETEVVRGGRESANYGKASSSSSSSGIKPGSAAPSSKAPDSGIDLSNLFVRYWKDSQGNVHEDRSEATHSLAYFALGLLQKRYKKGSNSDHPAADTNTASAASAATTSGSSSSSSYKKTAGAVPQDSKASRKRSASEQESDEKGVYVRTKRSATAAEQEQEAPAPAPAPAAAPAAVDPDDIVMSGYDQFGNPIIASRKKLASLNINDLVASLCRR